jgi:hypothetical protein
MISNADQTDKLAGRLLPEWAAFALAAMSFFVVLAFLCFFVFAARTPGLRKSVRGDFPQWMMAARLLRDAPDRLYDLESQQRRFRNLHETLETAGTADAKTAGAKGGTTTKAVRYPYLYPPFVAAFFIPIVAAPFPLSFLVWACISAILYVGSVVILAPSHGRIVAVWLAFASPLFLWYTLVYGQLSALACAAVAGAIFFERRGHPLLSGVALGLCVYKPTLLLWVIPMLLLGGRFRALLGVCCTGSVLAAVSLGVAGWRACLDWFLLLFRWGNHISIDGGKYPLAKFVDLSACTKMFTSQPKGVVFVFAAIVAAVSIIVTVRAWKGSIENRWAATLTLTLLVNVYAPMYDAVLLVLAILVLWRPDNARACAMFMIAVNLAAWWSEDLSRLGWPSPVTMVAFGFMLYQGYLTSHPIQPRGTASDAGAVEASPLLQASAL